MELKEGPVDGRAGTRCLLPLRLTGLCREQSRVLLYVAPHDIVLRRSSAHGGRRLMSSGHRAWQASHPTLVLKQLTLSKSFATSTVEVRCTCFICYAMAFPCFQTINPMQHLITQQDLQPCQTGSASRIAHTLPFSYMSEYQPASTDPALADPASSSPHPP